MALLALDQAGKTGWALLSGDEITFGTWDFTVYPWLGKKLSVLEGKLGAVWHTCKPNDPLTHIVFETPYVDHKTAQATARMLMSLAGLIEKVAVEQRVGFREYETKHWRKTFTGVARSNKRKGITRQDVKQLSVDRCKRLGHDVKDQDQAEAIGILHHAALDILGRTLAVAEGPLFEAPG